MAGATGAVCVRGRLLQLHLKTAAPEHVYLLHSLPHLLLPQDKQALAAQLKAAEASHRQAEFARARAEAIATARCGCGGGEHHTRMAGQ